MCFFATLGLGAEIPEPIPAATATAPAAFLAFHSFASFLASALRSLIRFFFALSLHYCHNCLSSTRNLSGQEPDSSLCNNTKSLSRRCSKV